MKLFKVVILVSVAFGLGLLGGYLWWERDVDRLRRELDRTRQGASAPASGNLSWSVTGIVRAVRSNERLVVITHEPIPGLMGGMTMQFRVEDGALLTGIVPGDRVQFTLVTLDKDLVLVTLSKEEKP